MLGHHFWTMSARPGWKTKPSFQKPGHPGDLILLYLTGAGPCSIDSKIGLGDRTKLIVGDARDSGLWPAE